MKRTLVYAAVFAVASAAPISTSYANAKTDNGIRNIDNNVEFTPSHWRLVKHAFQINIPQDKNALSQLIIDVPSTVAVSNDIDVLNENGQKVNINVSAQGRRIIIAFPEQVISNTKLLIELNKVKQLIQGPASVYSLSAKKVGSNEEIPVGVARFTSF